MQSFDLSDVLKTGSRQTNLSLFASCNMTVFLEQGRRSRQIDNILWQDTHRACS